MRRRAAHQQRERDIFLAFILNTAFALLEAVGGVFTNSLAIVSNALHDVGDSVSLLSAYVSERTSHRLPDERRTFGYRRFSLLAAFVNANILFTGSLLVLTKALPRVWDPEPVHSPGMLMLSALGILFNVLGVVRLSRGSSLSERVLRWHLWEDVLGWVVIAIVGGALLVWDIPVLDPLLTILFTVVILANVWRNLKEAVNLLLEGVPAAKSLAWVERLLRAHPGVASVHDIHLWSLDGEQDLLSAHVVPRAPGSRSQLLRSLKERVRHHGIEHAVFELEEDGSCAGGAERRIRSHLHPRVLPSLLFAIREAVRPGRNRIE